MNDIKSSKRGIPLCVFCSGSENIGEKFLELAYSFGQLLVEEGFELVYGGGKNGMMGKVAQGVLDAGGHVTGISTVILESKELHHTKLPELRIASGMSERKEGLLEKPLAIVTLFGGIGTLEEFFQAISWKSLGISSCQKPILLVNTDGCYDHLIEHIEDSKSKKVIKEKPLFDTVTSLEEARKWLREVR